MPKFKNGLAKVGRVYHYKFEFRGKPYHGSTGCETRSAADVVLRKLREDAALRAMGIRPETDAPTLEEVAREWAHVQELRKGIGTTHVRNVMGHCGLVRDEAGQGWNPSATLGYLSSLLTDRIPEITQGKAQKVVDDYLKVSGNTAGGANVLLRSLYLVIGFALKRDYIVKRPFKLELLDVQEKPKPWVPAERFPEFFQTLQAQGAPLKAQRLCWLMMTLGLRESEARHARVEHTDLVNLWHIPFDPEVGTKGGEADPVPIFNWAVAEVAAMIGDRREGLIVPGRFPERPTRRCYTLAYVKAAGEAMGIPGLTSHDLRGTYATLLSLEGAQVKAIQKAMRHKDPRTTEIYIRPVMSSVRDAGSRVGVKTGFSESPGTILAHPQKSKRQLQTEKLVNR